MTRLPVDSILPDLTATCHRGPVVLQAPTGAGKTTRVPPALLDHVPGRILVLEPRRVAARAAARRMAAERGESVGGTVGYQVRLDARFGPHTRILVVTEGVLLARLRDDLFLDGVGAVVFDEVHERRLDADLALALVRELREVRDDLVLIAMSATLDADALAAWLDASVLTSAGRAHAVTIRHAAHPSSAPLPGRAAAAVREALADADGDILVFLPGVGAIRRTAEALGRVPGWDVLPLHGRLSADAQDRVLAPGGRRIVLATNVAETSVTLPGVTTVVDSGAVKRLRFDPGTGLDRLVEERVSRASADQRAGRAGRVRPGRCIRLWTVREHRALDAFETPEVRRADLCGAVLHLLGEGADPRTFGWFEAPPAAAIDRALATLVDLGAVDDGITPLGGRLAGLPVHPRLGRLLVEAQDRGVVSEAAAVAAVLSDRDPVGRRPATHASGSDLLDRARVVGELPRDHVLRRLARRLAATVGRGPRADDVPAALGQAVLAAWPDRVARRRAAGSDRLKLVGGRGARLAPASAVKDAALLVAVAVDDAGAEAVVHLASAVDPAWLPTHSVDAAVWDGDRARAVRRVQYRDLVLAEHATAGTPAELSAMLAAHAAGRDDLIPADDDAHRLLARLAFLRDRRPDLGLPDDPVSEALPSLCAERRSLAELRRAPWIGAILDTLAWTQRQALDRLAPDRLQVPSGSRVRVDYPSDGPPTLAVRIQELFGWHETPRVAGVPLRLRLLAPNNRPAQITDDLGRFWRTSYADVRKDLRGRYPKHAWPEDPLTATAERRPRRRR